MSRDGIDDDILRSIKQDGIEKIFEWFKNSRYSVDYCSEAIPRDKESLKDLLSAQDQQQNTLLHITVRHRDFEFVKQVVGLYKSAGIILDTKNEKGNTPLLHLFATDANFTRNYCGDVPKIALHLLESGADISATNNQGQNIFHVIAESSTVLEESVGRDKGRQDIIIKILKKAMTAGVEFDERMMNRSAFAGLFTEAEKQYSQEVAGKALPVLLGINDSSGQPNFSPPIASICLGYISGAGTAASVSEVKEADIPPATVYTGEHAQRFADEAKKKSNEGPADCCRIL